MIADYQAEYVALYAELFGQRGKSSDSQRTKAGVESASTSASSSRFHDLTDEQLIEKAKAADDGGKFLRLWAGDTSMHCGDDSAADLALCNKLAWWCGGPDPDRIDRLFRQSGLMRGKWDEHHGEKTYGQLTIDAALEGRTNYYSPAGSTGTGGAQEQAHGPQDGTQQPGAQAKPPQFRSPVPASQLAANSGGVQWILEDYFPRDAVALLTAVWKAGKTTLLSRLLRALQHGGEFCGRTVAQCRVLYVTEESEILWAARRDELGLTDAIHFDSRPFKGRPNVVTWLAYIGHLQKWCDAHAIDVIIFDTLSALWPVNDENNAAEVQAALMPLQGLAKGRLVLPVHHNRKSDGQEATAARGSGALPAFVDVILELRRFAPDKLTNRRRTLTCFSRYPEAPAELIIELAADGSDYHAIGGRQEATMSELVPEILARLPVGGSGVTAEDLLAQKWNPKPPTRGKLMAALHQGAKDGKWVEGGDGKRGSPYRWWRSPTPP